MSTEIPEGYTIDNATGKIIPIPSFDVSGANPPIDWGDEELDLNVNVTNPSGVADPNALSKFIDAFKNIDPVAAAALLGIPAIANLISSGAATPPATTPPATTPPPPPPATTPPADPTKTTTTSTTTSTDPTKTTTDPAADPTKTTTTSPNPTEDELVKAAKSMGLDAATIATLLKFGLPVLSAFLSYKSAQNARDEARGASFGASSPVTATRRAYEGSKYTKPAAQGGIMSLAGGGSLQDEMIAARGKQLNPATGPQMAGADYAHFAKSQAEKDVAKFINDLKNLGLTDPEALEVYASNFGTGPIYKEYEESGLDFSPRLNAKTEETANVIRALGMPSAQAQSDYEVNTSELMGEPTYDIGIPQLYEGNMPASMLNPEYDFSGNMSKADLRRAGMPDDENNDEELGSSYSGLALLQALKMGEDTTQQRAAGGVMSLGMARGRYLGGMSDGMADEVPAHIDGKRPAALSDGEFVIPADVVSHLGNGNSNAGAKRLYEMMDNIRSARTGTTKQGIQINPNKFMPR